MAISERSEDSRRYKRVPFKRGVRVCHQSRGVFEGNLAQDISQGGVRVFTSDFIPILTVVTVLVQLKDKTSVLEFQAKVVWVRYNPLSENYQLGLEFMDDKLRANEAVAQFVESL